ncbi:MAG: PIG-L deacetylase family protein [Acidimicrobiales bacterium]
MSDRDEGSAAAGMRAWGLVDESTLDRPVVISPHLDDAVLSCGQFLAAHPGTTVVTVFSGIPERYPDPPSRWSILGGFTAEDDVVAARRAEDRRALDRLGATPRWLDFLESMFTADDDRPTEAEIADALDAVLDELEPTVVLVPFGLANAEHVIVHDASLRVRERGGPRPVEWVAYEDIAYKHIPGQLAWRVATLFKAAVWPTPLAMPVDPLLDAKRAAVAEYTSQVRALEADWILWPRLDAPTPEQYWRLDAPPPGWEAMIDLV